jgi:hypothetical protein
MSDLDEKTRLPIGWFVAAVAFAATGAWATAGLIWRMDQRVNRVEIRTTLIMQHLKINDPTQPPEGGLIFDDAAASSK